jgi:hypothetical protein
MKSLCIWMAILILPAAAGAADLCAKVKAGVEIKALSFENGTVKASGTWRVGEDSVGAMLEYRLQSDRQWAESRSGTSGTWEISLPWDKCYRSGFRVDVFPTLKVGNLLVHCTENGGSAVQIFMASCAPSVALGPCQWECSEESPTQCSGTCTGTAKGGNGNLVALQGVNGKDFQVIEGPPRGPWSWSVTCSPGDKVSFKVRDQSGTGGFSNEAEWPCGKE